MNKQTTAIEWWENTVYNAAKRVEWKIKLNFKYYGWDKDYNRLTDEEIEHIYLSENPQTETKVEDVQVGGFNLLLNEGEDDEQTVSLVDYINMFDEDMEDDFIKVINLLSGQSYQYGADNIKRI